MPTETSYMLAKKKKKMELKNFLVSKVEDFSFQESRVSRPFNLVAYNCHSTGVRYSVHFKGTVIT